MPTKKDLEEGISLYKEQIDFYREQLHASNLEKEALREQVCKLQDALINIRAPEAYQDYLYDRDTPDPRNPEDVEKDRKIREIQKQYIEEVEKPLFKSASDLEDLLVPALNRNAKQNTEISLHNNNES